MGIGHRRPCAAAAVACGSRIRAGTDRAGTQHAAVIDPDDRSSAGADGVDIDDRCAHGQAVNREFGGKLGPSVGHEADVGRGSSHVEGDEIPVTRPAGLADRTSHARCGPRQQYGDRIAPHAVCGQASSVRLHDRKASAETVAREMVLEALEIAVDDRLDIGRERGRGCPFVFPEFPGDGGRARNLHALAVAGDDAREFFLVRRVGVSVQETDRYGIVPAFTKPRNEVSFDRPDVERGMHTAVGKNPLGNLEGIAPAHHRLGLSVGQVIDAAAVVPLHDEVSRESPWW